MKKSVYGKEYDTDNAIYIGEHDNGLGVGNLYHSHECLYQNYNGDFFFMGKGGWLSRFSGNTFEEVEFDNIVPCDYTEAKMWCKAFLNIHSYNELFGEIPSIKKKGGIHL